MSYEAILSRDSFLLASELRIFWAIAAAYGFSLLLHLLHVLTAGALAGRAAHVLLGVAGAAHAGLIVLRAFEAGRAPFQTLYESLSLFACSAVLTWIFVSRRWKGVYLPGALVSSLALGASVYALTARSPAIGPLSPPLQSWWFEWHVILAFFSYAVFVVSAAVELSWLVARPLARGGRASLYGIAPDRLDEFRATAKRLALFGFPLLTFGIFSGAAWANEAWGRYWSWDPKETWSLITWTVFAIYLHSTTMPSLRGAPASAFNILGLACMLMTFLGVNWLARLLGMTSLHAYPV